MNTLRLSGLLLSALLIGSCSNSKQEAGSGLPVQKKTPGVKIMVLKPKPIASRIKVTGTVDSRLRTWVIAPSEGTVLSLEVREGNTVSPGSVIGYVMSSDQQNMLALTQVEYDQARSAANNDSDVTVKAAKSRFDAAKALYKPVPIVCPIKGIVITKAIEPGAVVTARQQLAEIADLQQIVVKSAVSEEYISFVKSNQNVRVTVSGNDSSVMGTVALIYPSIDIRSRTMGLEIALKSSKNLRPGMSATVEFTIAAHPSALAVPYDAVLVRPNGDKVVFTVSNSTAHAHKVTTGIETNSAIEITGGLASGDSVIILGQDNLKDSAVVKIMDSAAQSAKGGQKK